MTGPANMEDAAGKAAKAAIAEEAAEWVVRLNAKKLSREDAFAFEGWLNESDAHKQAFRQASEVWLEVGDALDPPAAATEPISLSRAFSASRRLNPAIAWASGAALAACCAALAFVAFAAAPVFSGPKVERAAYVSVIGEEKTVNLSDGSSIQLNTDSAIEVVTRRTNAAFGC